MLTNKDAILIDKIAEGDIQAENELFLHLVEKVKFIVRVRLKGKANLEDQNDIVSEIQHAVLMNLRKGAYDPAKGKSLEAYVIGIINNIIGQYFRKLINKKEMEVEDLDGFAQNQESVLSGLLDEERSIKLRKCLQRLKPKYSEVLLLRVYEKKSIEEIAQKLNLERRRVSERINYAFKLFLEESKKDNYFQYFDEYHK